MRRGWTVGYVHVRDRRPNAAHLIATWSYEADRDRDLADETLVPVFPPAEGGERRPETTNMRAFGLARTCAIPIQATFARLDGAIGSRVAISALPRWRPCCLCSRNRLSFLRVPFLGIIGGSPMLSNFLQIRLSESGKHGT